MTLPTLNSRIYKPTTTDPAANVEVLITVPAGVKWKVQSLLNKLVTDANVATRNVEVRVDDGTDAGIIYTTTAGPDHTASQTRSYNYIKDVKADESAFDSNNIVKMYLPDIWLAPASRIRTITANLQVTDNYAAPIITVEELPNPAS